MGVVRSGSVEGGWKEVWLAGWRTGIFNLFASLNDVIVVGGEHRPDEMLFVDWSNFTRRDDISTIVTFQTRDMTLASGDAPSDGWDG